MTPNRASGTDGKIEHLFIKTSRGQVSTELARGLSLVCVANLGIEGDVHANRLSPRQILITLASDLEEFSIQPGALRENMVISLAPKQHFRPGAAIVTSSGVEIRLTMYCEPCERISPLIADLRRIINRRGILGAIVNGGVVSAGDTFRLIPEQYAPLAESPVQRFLDFVATIPEGKVVRYSDVAIGIGVADSFVRALPGYIRRNLHQRVPLHRIVNAQGHLLNGVPDQAEKLTSEGVQVQRSGDMRRPIAKVDLENYLWRG